MWSRKEPLPLAGYRLPKSSMSSWKPVSGCGTDRDGHLGAALDSLARTSPYERRILENSYGSLWQAFQADHLRASVNGELGEQTCSMAGAGSKVSVEEAGMSAHIQPVSYTSWPGILQQSRHTR